MAYFYAELLSKENRWSKVRNVYHAQEVKEQVGVGKKV